jgi:PEGA domain
VFVDGYFVGTADKFDGAFERLRVEAGEHELEFYLEGYRTARQPVLFRREGTITIKHAMEPLTAGQTSEKPVPTTPPADAARQAQPPDDPPAGYRGRPGDRNPPPPRGSQRGDDFGTLAIRVQPADAEILIDGERWDGSEGGSRLSVQLGEGPHRIEIRKDGFKSYTANVRIRRGQTETLNVSLTQ